MKKICLIYLLLSLQMSIAFSQIYEVPLEERISNASWVVEGKVIEKTSFWDAGHQHIYTSNIIKTGKYYKGKLRKGLIEIITDGGTVDTSMEIVSPALHLEVGDAGIFICSRSRVNFPTAIRNNGKSKMVCGSDEQGFIKYDSLTGTASDAFHDYGSIRNLLIPLIKKLVKNKNRSKDEGEQSLFPDSEQDNSSVENVQAVSSFSPASVVAGNRTVLTIYGSGFGSTQGSVVFSNADNGGRTIDITPLPSQYRLWTDTQIQVEVPSGAGTGPFRIISGAGISQTSPSSLVVQYNVSNVNYNGMAYIPKLVNRNGSGGYSWQMNSNFYNNTAARAAFARAMETWRCSTFVNFALGAVTANNTAARDGVIVVRYDVGSELPLGVLGRCVSYYSGCGSGGIITWFVSEFDITFDDATNWYYGTSEPGFSQYDFQSVALHELGHGHQLGHVINTADVMHYALTNGQTRRMLNADDVNGGRFVTNLSSSGTACGFAPMVPLTPTNCTLPVPVAIVSEETSQGNTGSTWALSAKPSGDELSFVVKTGETEALHIVVYNLSGGAVWEMREGETNKEIKLAGISRGIYLLVAVHGKEKITTKFIKN